MTDRELLERAARAAGLRIAYWASDTYPVVLDDEDNKYGWNPLLYGSDALNIAVSLRITPHIDSNMTDCEGCTEAHLGDPYAATRRAIVRAAAALAGDAP